MADVNQSVILDALTRHYLESHDFNGMAAGALTQTTQASWDELRLYLEPLIEAQLIGVLGSEMGNPHIVRVGFPDTATQIESLAKPDPYHTCLYPRTDHLKQVVAPDLFEDEPYKRELALGAPQLSFRPFDLSVLEYYRNDPRYLYTNDDVSGRVCVSDEFFQSQQMVDSDQVLLQTFGFAYDADFNRSVAVFIRYLADLSPEHQRVWRAKELTADYELHPDYYRPSILGEWPEGISMCRALIEELQVINDMAVALGREPLFRTDFRDNRTTVPREFCLLIRPTCKEFNNFVHVLDKLLSENINKRCFGTDVSFEVETQRKDGRIQVEQKGTLRALDEWIRMQFHTENWTQWNESIEAMRRVRKLRQRPAHGLDDDKFDQQYIKDQRELMIQAYSAVRTLRLILENHPSIDASRIKMSDWLREGKIWTR
jgi:hypothetical protein